MAQPLDGLLVVALEQAVAAPFCTALLADSGARVIKIERAVGDFAREPHFVSNDDHGQALFMGQRTNDIENLAYQFGVECRGDLVE